ncbi:MAG: hypothetical protein LBG84_00260, partial [Treponema sp.]|nr:hypothetical protein [Treponema sp.]
QNAESFWSIVATELRREPREIQTIWQDGTRGLWFSATLEYGVLVIDNAAVNRPPTRLTTPRSIGREEFKRIYPYYEPWLAGEYPRHEIRDRLGKNSSYILGVIHYFKNRTSKAKVTCIV